MSKLPLAELPFCIEEGEGIEEWDGETYFGVDSPSNSSEAQTSVVGEGTPWPIGVTLEELFKLYYRAAFLKVTGVVHVGDLYTSSEFDGWGTPIFEDRSVELDEGYLALLPTDAKRYEDIVILEEGSGWDDSYTSDPPKEEHELPCPSYLFLQAGEADPDEEFLMVFVELFLGSGSKAKKFEGLYYPKLEARVEWGNGYGPFNSNVIASSRKLTLPEWATTTHTEFEASAFEKDLKMYGAPAPAGSPPPLDFPFGYVWLHLKSATFTVVAKYLTYGGIYDEDTGEKVPPV